MFEDQPKLGAGGSRTGGSIRPRHEDGGGVRPAATGGGPLSSRPDESRSIFRKTVETWPKRSGVRAAPGSPENGPRLRLGLARLGRLGRANGATGKGGRIRARSHAPPSRRPAHLVGTGPRPEQSDARRRGAGRA